MIENGPSKHVREKNVQRDRRWLEFADEGKSLGASPCYQNFKSGVVSKIAEDTRVMCIIFHDEHNIVARLHGFAIIGDALGAVNFGGDRYRRQRDRL